MHPNIAGYQIEAQIEHYYASGLFQARESLSDKPVLIKTLTSDLPEVRDIKRLEREYWLLKEFQGIGGVLPVRDMQFSGNGNPAVVSDTFGLPLSHSLESGATTQWSLERKISLMVQIAEAVDAVHARNIVHKNIAPQNILLDPDVWTVKLMNFEIATSLSREHQDRSLSKRLEGSLPYIAPEQTGRMSHDVDHRSDFYSIGVVFFQLLFGKLPFEAVTQLEWVHAHVGKEPTVPDAPEMSLPQPLIDIVMRLLEKSPEARYQSCFGLLEDLRLCYQQIQSTGRIEPFALAHNDISEVFHIPQQLFGREGETARLMRLFDRAASGACEVCLITGFSGVGKSALVEALDKAIVSAGGYILRGKFDQFERAKPYAGISAAFGGLVQELLTESSAYLSGWKDDMLALLGPNAQVLIEVIPGLETILGTQPPALALPPTEAQNRLQITFLNFVRRLTRDGRPLVLYLDDLQWSDAPTLNLLQRLASARDIGHFLVIGSYRNNEVDRRHQVSLMRDEIAKSRKVRVLNLAPLDGHAVNQMVAGALRTDLATASELSELLFRQTEGNPFFVTELLKTFVEESLIQFDRRHGRWSWDIAAINRAELGDSVVEFLIGNLSRLSSKTQEALRLAACIGHEFDLQMLSIVHQKSFQELGLALMSALNRNVILPLDDGYQLFDDTAARAETRLDPSVNPRFRFQHDRLHQAAYELIDEADKKRVHLTIGRLLQEDAKDHTTDAQVIKIVGHFNEAASLVVDPEEQEKHVRLNLRAARIAHDASSYQAGLHYLRHARAGLADNAWAEQYELTKDIVLLFAQTAYLNGLHDEADAELSAVLEHSRTNLEKAQVLSMRTRHYSTLGRMKESIDAALHGLGLLGIEISNDVPDDAVDAEIAAISDNLGGRAVADLIDAPRMTDPQISTAVGLLMEIFPPAFLSGAGKLFHLLVLKSVNLSLRHGNSAETAFAFAAYGMLLCGALNQPAKGNEYGKLALAMNESFDDIGLKSRILYVYTMFTHHWNHHWASMTELFKQGISSGYQSGDLLYLAYNAQDCVIWDPKLDIETAITKQRKYLEIVKDCNYADSFDSASLFFQMLLNFAGETEDQYSLSDAQFDEAACLAGMRARNFMTGVANYQIYKAEVHCLYRDFEGALPFVETQEAMTDSVMSLPQLVRFRFLAFLTYAALCDGKKGRDRKVFDARMRAHLDQMAIWAQNCPENFHHLEVAMQAEIARLDGQPIVAFQRFDEATRIADDNGFIRDRAMIHEMSAHAYSQIGLTEAAAGNLRAARGYYQRWGATRKLAQLDQAHPGLHDKRAVTVSNSLSGSLESEGMITQDQLDLASVMEAARAISSEIVLDQLLSRTMAILLEGTGAQRGVFVSKENGDLKVEVAQKSDGQKEKSARRPTNDQDIPLSVIHYVMRTRAPLVLDDASDASNFSSDPYIARRRTKSVLCAPILRTESFEAVIYLENDLATGAFPEERVALVDLLAAQASISIENAKLYDGLEQKVQERTAELSEKTTALEAVANQLSKYLSPQVYRSIFDHRKEVRLASERKTLTIFFSDLVAFTETADQMRSEDLTVLLNQYLSEMADVALSYGATIDKFVGDAIVIFFGDPETRGVQQDAQACAQMAIFMRDRLATLRKTWRDAGVKRPLQARMGIHTGQCTVGNFGSESRMDYTMIGGAVNLASRLEGAARPGSILISDATYHQIKNTVRCRKAGKIRVRGIAQPVDTYEVLDMLDPATQPSLSDLKVEAPAEDTLTTTTHRTKTELN